MADRRFHTLLFFFGIAFCLMLAACAGKESPQPSAAPPAPESPPDPAPEKDFIGPSGKYKPEAEQAFAEARVLWRRDVASVSAAESCTDPEKAVSLLSKAISLEPKYAEAYVRRGLARSELGKREEAFDDLTEAVRLNASPESYAYRGLVCLRAGEERAAQRDLQYSLKLKSSQHLAHNLMGVLELKRDKKSLACESFTKGCSNGDCAFIESARKEKICP